MFFEVVKKGIESEETSISHDEALRVISGGLIQFMSDFKSGNMNNCKRQLFCIAKATNALHEGERKRYAALLGLLASVDPCSRDCTFIFDIIAETIGVEKQELGKVIEAIRENIDFHNTAI